MAAGKRWPQAVRWWALSAVMMAVVALMGWWQLRPLPQTRTVTVVLSPSSSLAPASSVITVPPAVSAPPPSLPPPLRRLPRSLPPRLGAPPLARRIVLPHLNLPDEPAAQLYRELLPVAQSGDDTAMYALARVLADCNGVPVDEQAVEQKIEQVRRTHFNIDTAVRYPRQFAADLHRKFQHCAGLDAGQRASYYAWLIQAADGGQLDALENFQLFDPPGEICRQYDFARCTPQQQAASRAARQVIARYLLAAGEAGSLNALWQLGAAYLDGELLPENRVAAFAYLLAYQRATRAFGLHDAAAGLVRDLRRQLGPGDRAAAAEQARTLLANPRCCVLIQ